MGEFISTVIGLLFLVGSFCIFKSMIADKHYERPVKHNAFDENDELQDLTDAIDVMVMDEFSEGDV